MVSSGCFFSFSPSEKLSSHTYTRIRCISLCFVSFHDHWCPLVGRWVTISGIPSSRPYIHSSSPALLLRHVTAQHCTLPYPDLPYPTLTYLLPHRTAVTLTCPSVPFLPWPDLSQSLCLCCRMGIHPSTGRPSMAIWRQSPSSWRGAPMSKQRTR